MSTLVCAVLDCVTDHASVIALGEGDVPGQSGPLPVGGKGGVIIMRQVGCPGGENVSSDLGCKRRLS